MGRLRQTQRFYDLIWPHRADVLRVAQFHSHDYSVAEDLAQETLLKAFNAIEQLDRPQGNVRKWLLTILRNTWLDRLRANARKPAEIGLQELQDEIPSRAMVGNFSGASGDPQATLNDFSDQQVIDALKALPDEIRWTLLLVDVEGLTQQESAEILAVPEGTIKSRAHRGRHMLREMLLPIAEESGWTPKAMGPTSSDEETV